MKKILLVQTGGTIGSVECDGVISASPDGSFINKLSGIDEGQCSFEIIQPLNILSENLSLEHWETLTDTLSGIDADFYDGIIITHGSDTLSYTSAFLGIMLSDTPVPVIITAANYVPDDPRSNASDNLRAAIFLIEEGIPGVYTVYRNPGDKYVSVFLPEKIIEADRFLDRFGSTDGTPAAAVYENNITFSENICKTAVRKSNLFCRKIHFDKTVLLLHPCPSFPYDEIVLQENTGAVLLTTYHSGTVPQSAAVLIEKCRSRNIPVYICSLKTPETSVYETTNDLLEKGVFPLYGMTTEAAYAKLLTDLNI